MYIRGAIGSQIPNREIGNLVINVSPKRKDRRSASSFENTFEVIYNFPIMTALRQTAFFFSLQLLQNYFCSMLIGTLGHCPVSWSQRIEILEPYSFYFIYLFFIKFHFLLWLGFTCRGGNKPPQNEIHLYTTVTCLCTRIIVLQLCHLFLFNFPIFYDFSLF